MVNPYSKDSIEAHENGDYDGLGAPRGIMWAVCVMTPVAAFAYFIGRTKGWW